MRRRRVPPAGRLMHLAAAAAAAAVLNLAGCASFPSPSSDSESLFIFLTENPAPRGGIERGPLELRFDGPSSFRIPVGEEQQRAFYFKIRPGRYALADSAAVGMEASASALNVPPGAVFLCPYKLTRLRSSPLVRSRALVPLGPDDQQTASGLLTDWLDYEKWFGREIVGFGPYPPRVGSQEERVQFDVSSSPPGATVTIDDQPYGVTPVTTHLQVGKHLLQLEIPGVALTKTFVDVQGKGEINVSLPILPQKEAEQAKASSGKITILLSAFQNMGSADSDNLAAAFPQVIGSDLAGDERLSLVDAGELVARSAGVPGRPDFALANTRGVDLIVSGYYTARPDGLLVYAALYDVRNEIARTSIIYTGKAGLAMFDSIDAMAAEFIKGIDRVLPEVHASSIEQGGTVQSRVVTYEKKRSQTYVIQKRQSRLDSITFVLGPNFGQTGGITYPPMPDGLLAFVPPGILYEHSFGGPWSISALVQPAVAYSANTQNGADYSATPFVSIPVSVGPEYTLSGYNVDVSFGLLAEGRFTWAFFDSGNGPQTRQQILSGALAMQTSARLYLQSRISEMPSFVYLGFNWFLIGGQMDTDFRNLRAIPIELSLNLGYGVRL
jgi:hypothetical protein